VVAECYDLGNGVSVDPSIGSTATSASLDWTFDVGYLFGEHTADISESAAAAGISGATAQSEFGFRDIFDVSSAGTEMVQLDFPPTVHRRQVDPNGVSGGVEMAARSSFAPDRDGGRIGALRRQIEAAGQAMVPPACGIVTGNRGVSPARQPV
jgi:hypothetical protein